MAKKICLAVISIGLIYFLYACGDQGSGPAANKTLASLSISPTSASLTVGSSETFYAMATYTNGAVAAIVPVWTATGSLGAVTIVGYAGRFAASTPGSCEMIATSGGFSAEASLIITAGPTPEPGGLTTIEVTPAYIDLPANTSQIFTASGLNNSGEAIGILPSWSLTGAAVGTLTFSGAIATLETTADGQAFINCTSGEVTTSVPVTVEGATVNITADADTYVDQSTPATVVGGQTTLQAGYVSPNHLEAYMHFPLASLPAGVSVESAAFQLYANSADSVAFQFFNLTSGFNASTTWNTKPNDGTSEGSATFSAGQYNNISSDSLTGLVRTWYASPAANFGLALRQDSVTNNSDVAILSKENGANPPVLIITYK